MCTLTLYISLASGGVEDITKQAPEEKTAAKGSGGSRTRREGSVRTSQVFARKKPLTKKEVVNLTKEEVVRCRSKVARNKPTSDEQIAFDEKSVTGVIKKVVHWRSKVSWKKPSTDDEKIIFNEKSVIGFVSQKVLQW